jgi:hypothetical protein
MTPRHLSRPLRHTIQSKLRSGSSDYAPVSSIKAGDADMSDADISISVISDVSSVTIHDYDDDVNSVSDHNIDDECSLLSTVHDDTEAALAMLSDTVLCLIKHEEQVLLPKAVRFQLGINHGQQQQQQHLFEQVSHHDSCLPCAVQ